MSRDESLPIGTITPEQRQIIADAKQGQAVEEYLQSEQAAQDVARLLAGEDVQHLRSILCGAWTSVGHAFCGTRAVSPPDGPWWPLPVYYRPEGDRYLVTDMGEAVRALRLRTGQMGNKASDAAVDKAAGAALGWPHAPPWTWSGDAMLLPLVAAADLPRAIVRVMLAAYRVAALEVA